MEFLYKLYDLPNFGIILFAIIAILLILFLVILLFGKKDERIRLEETRKLELANTEAFKDVDENTKELKIPEIEQPVVEKANEEVKTIENTVKPMEIEQPKLAGFEIPKPKVDNNESGIFNDVKKEEVPGRLDLPKMADLPKLKEDTTNNSQTSDASIFYFLL